MSVGAHVGEVGEGEASVFPFLHCQLGWSNFDPVLIIGRAIAKGCAACGVDFAHVAVVLVHGGPHFCITLALRRIWLSNCRIATIMTFLEGGERARRCLGSVKKREA